MGRDGKALESRSDRLVLNLLTHAESEEWLLLVCGYRLDVRARADFIIVALMLFSRVDVRVDVVSAYVLDLEARGEQVLCVRVVICVQPYILVYASVGWITCLWSCTKYVVHSQF